VGAVGHDDVALHAVEQAVQLVEQRRESQIEEDIAILGMIDDVAELIDRQPRIDRVADGADARDGVVQLQVPVRIPGDGGDAIVGPYAQRLQRVGELTAAPGSIPIGITMQVAFRGPRNDFLLRIARGRVFDDLRGHQGPIHHQSTHVCSPDF
jgi:hypothetical protein